MGTAAGIDGSASEEMTDRHPRYRLIKEKFPQDRHSLLGRKKLALPDHAAPEYGRQALAQDSDESQVRHRPPPRVSRKPCDDRPC